VCASKTISHAVDISRVYRCTLGCYNVAVDSTQGGRVMLAETCSNGIAPGRRSDSDAEYWRQRISPIEPALRTGTE
jgi:hypothetical protein